MADTTIELPARPFAAAWLNVARAAADDPDRPQLYRSVIVELLDDHSVRLVSTDSFMLLRSHVRLDRDAPNWLGHVTDDEHPYLTITALDWDHRAQALLKYALKATKDDPAALIHLSIVNLEEPDVPTLTEDLDRMGLSIEFQNERLVLDLFDADPITWRPLFENREPAACDRVAYNPEFLARLADPDRHADHPLGVVRTRRPPRAHRDHRRRRAAPRRRRHAGPDRRVTNTAAGQLELGACGATARHPSYGRRTCVLPAGHQPPPGRPPTSTDGWHESADRIRWATHVTATTQKGGTGA